MKHTPEEIKNYIKASVNRKSNEIGRALIHHEENQDDILAAAKIVFMYGVLEAIDRSLEKVTVIREDEAKVYFRGEEMIELMEDAILEFILSGKESRKKHENN